MLDLYKKEEKVESGSPEKKVGKHWFKGWTATIRDFIVVPAVIKCGGSYI